MQEAAQTGCLYLVASPRSTCDGGKWRCSENVCPTRCVVEGQFVTTYDGKQYSVPGKCSYVASQVNHFCLKSPFTATWLDKLTPHLYFPPGRQLEDKNWVFQEVTLSEDGYSPAFPGTSSWNSNTHYNELNYIEYEGATMSFPFILCICELAGKVLLFTQRCQSWRGGDRWASSIW